jgi:hypothetical protein
MIKKGVRWTKRADENSLLYLFSGFREEKKTETMNVNGLNEIRGSAHKREKSVEKTIHGNIYIYTWCALSILHDCLVGPIQ